VRILEIERGITRSHCVENWLWKRLWASHKTDCGMNELTFWCLGMEMDCFFLKYGNTFLRLF